MRTHDEPPVVRDTTVAGVPSIAAIGRVAFPAVHDVVVGAEFSAAVVAQTYSIEALTACITRCATADDAAFLLAERDGGVVGYLHYDCEGARARSPSCTGSTSIRAPSGAGSETR